MTVAAALVVGVLFATSVYLLLSANVQRVAFGFLLLTNAVNLTVLAATGVPEGARPPFVGQGEGPMADPLPQAFILTAIVIGLGATAYLIAHAAAVHHATGSDEVEG